MRRLISILILFTSAFTVIGQTTIKFATLAPDGSTWMKVMDDFTKAVSDTTGGDIKFKIRSGGVSGDEMVVLRKIRIGQLHGGGFTGVALGEILPEVRILDAPFLFRSYEEIDFIGAKLFDYFAQKFEEKGFVLLGWAEVGFVYIFTNQPVNSLADMNGVKMWMWEGDPIAEATFNAFNVSPIPLSVTDVLTSLQTNLINGVYVSPLACVALQWHTKVKNMLDLPLANASGAVLLSKKQYAKLSAENQKILKDLSKKYFTKLTRLSREDNAKSLELVRGTGIEFTQLQSQELTDRFLEAGKTARLNLIGKLYDSDFLNTVENDLIQFRQEQVLQDSR